MPHWALALGLAGDRCWGVFRVINLVPAALVLSLSWAALKVSLNHKRNRRLLADTPTSKALGVFIGQVEVEGVCVSQKPLISHLVLKPCVHYRWEVQEHWVRGSGKNRESGADVVASGCHSIGFYVQDETGFIWVNPAGAEIDPCEIFDKTVTKRDPLYYAKGPRESVTGSTGQRTFTEHALTVGSKVFIRGRASERPNVVAAQIAQGEEADMFIISGHTEESISDEMSGRALAWDLAGWFIAFNAVLVATAGPGPVLKVYFGLLKIILVAIAGDALDIEFDLHGELFAEGMAAISIYIPLGVLISLSLHLLARVVSWPVMAFNSIIGLRNRVAQAYSLIDVQLKRRTDLIGRFAACVQGFREHEASVQALVTAMWTEAEGGAMKALAPGILAVIESYPEIRAQALFNDLSKQLIETEDRIALAREYHNNIATLYNTRLERVPDRYLAGLVRMKPAALFEAEGFTSHPATVAF